MEPISTGQNFGRVIFWGGKWLLRDNLDVNLPSDTTNLHSQVFSPSHFPHGTLPRQRFNERVWFMKVYIKELSINFWNKWC